MHGDIFAMYCSLTLDREYFAYLTTITHPGPTTDGVRDPNPPRRCQLGWQRRGGKAFFLLLS